VIRSILIEEVDVIDESSSRSRRTSGLTLFYTEFYDRLTKDDSDGLFDALLTKHAVGQNQIAFKGAILVRIIKFLLTIKSDSHESQAKLVALGKAHNRKGIRPWQYSFFIRTLLLTISSRLGCQATADVMESWVHLFAYTFKYMLPHAIKGLINEREINFMSQGQMGTADRLCKEKSMPMLTISSNVSSKSKRFKGINQSTEI
jgi:hemoglobin-like flavoprotein